MPGMIIYYYFLLLLYITIFPILPLRRPHPYYTAGQSRTGS